jgi:hypothetical protein
MAAHAAFFFQQEQRQYDIDGMIYLGTIYLTVCRKQLFASTRLIRFDDADDDASRQQQTIGRT